MRRTCSATVICVKRILSSTIVAFLILGAIAANSAQALPAKFSNSTEATFNFSSSEPDVIFECSLNNSSWEECAPPVTYTNLTEGPQGFRVRSTDQAGNVGPPAEYTWTIDLTRPNVEITDSPPAISDSEAEFVFQADESSTYQCSLNDEPWESCDSPKVYSELDNGSHNFKVRAIDLAGNISDPETYDWEASSTIGAVIVVHPLLRSNSASASFEFDSNEPEAVFECSLDNESWEFCDNPKTYDSLSDGIHNFRVRATANGETSPAKSWDWEIDTQSPVLTILSGPNNSEAITASLAFSADEEVVFECRLNSGEWETCISEKQYVNLNQGEYVFEVRAVDAFGNSSNTAEHAWTVIAPEPEPEPEKPVLSMLSTPKQNSLSSSATFKFDSDSSGSTYRCRIDNQSWKPCVSPVLYKKLKFGDHTFRVQALSGEERSKVLSYSWRVLSNNPTECKISNVRSRFFVFHSKNAIRLVALYKAENRGEVKVTFYKRQKNGGAGERIASMKASFRKAPEDYALFRVLKNRTADQMSELRNSRYGFVAKLKVKNAPGYCEELYNLKLELVAKRIVKGQQTFFQKGSFNR